MLSWVVVKKAVEVDTRPMWKEIGKEIEMGERKKQDTRNSDNIQELAKEVGWLDVFKEEWKIRKKKEMWWDIHRDIVSTPIVTRWNTGIEGNHVVYCLLEKIW